MRAKATIPGSISPDARAARSMADPSLSRGLRATAMLLAAWSVLALVTQSGDASVATVFFNRDATWLLVFAAVLGILSLLSDDAFAWLPSGLSVPPAWSALSATPLVLIAAAAATIGPRLVFHGHAFTQDETMAQFDAAIFRTGHWVARIPDTWRPYADALEPRFTMPVADHAAWISCYLPGNAAIRAVLDQLFGLDLASAVLAAVAILAVGGVARQLWPDRRDAAFVAALLLTLSPQFLFTAATPFAMTAHLALDLLWLWLFLRGGLLGHGGAIAVTIVACGLHQLVFHPLFACPFVLQLWLGRRWRLAALYTAVFAAAGLLWILYWQLMLRHVGLQGTGATGSGLSPFVGEVLGLVGAFSWSGLDLMAKNISRFLAWQNLVALPLALIGVASLGRSRPPRLQQPLVALAAGFVLTLVAMFVLLPNQGFGWGYRYLHGLLGSFALLAAAGWVAVTSRPLPRERTSRDWALVGLSGLLAAVVGLPLRGSEIEQVVAPYARAEQAIQTAPSDLVFVDGNGIAYATALVRNDPFLRNRPLVLDLSQLTAAQVDTLCRTRRAMVFDARDAETYGLIRAVRTADPPAIAALRADGCATAHVGAPH